MLAECFVQLLHYREEMSPSTPDGQRRQTHSPRIGSKNYDLEEFAVDEPESGPQRADISSANSPIKASSPAAVGLSIPGCSPVHTLESVLSSCSLLAQYPDLQVADSGLIPHNPAQADVGSLFSEPSDLQLRPVLVNPDQGYLVMGGNANPSMDMPSSRLEPMSNSLLNGLLDKQLEEVYLQHLTDNLARCNSHLGNSLLHGLVPPPKPSGGSQGTDSLDICLNEGSGTRQINYMCTQQSVPCSSHFSTPVLRISETENGPRK